MVQASDYTAGIVRGLRAEVLKTIIDEEAYILKELFRTIPELFEVPFVKRFVLSMLLPNVLVFGFTISNLDNNRNFLWATLIGPYWFIEKCVFFIFTAATLFAVAYDLNSLWHSHKRNRYDDDNLYGYTNVKSKPEPSQSKRLQTPSQLREKQNVLPFPEKSKAREQVSPVPPPAKLTAAELKKKALGDFIGGGR